MKISPVTRRDLFDALRVEGINWAGRLEEVEFLSRLYDLSSLPSDDGRFKDAEGDIWQHRVNNFDWEDDWVFSDRRFRLASGDDSILLRFLCETVHPVVRSDPTEVGRLVQLYNDILRSDGFQIVEKTRLSGKPVFVGREFTEVPAPGVSAAREAMKLPDASYVSQQITRMESAVNQDPGLAIGTAKELVETCCRTILTERAVDIPKNADLPKLVKLTAGELNLSPNDIPEEAKAADTIRRLLSNLATITQGVAELRNQYGTGHGQIASAKGLRPRHAKLAVGAASTLAVFLIETHQARKK